MPLGKCFAISPITGYSVVEASDGLEALGGLKEDSVDIVISDFALPKIHGLALVREIRSRSPAIGVIIISAYLGQRQEG